VFALDPPSLDTAAGRIDAVATSLTDLDVAGLFGAVDAALPGSATAGACRWTAAGLDAALDGWADHLLGLCEAARRVARDAAATDAAVAGELGRGAP
jgi:hypothetical protein